MSLRTAPGLLLAGVAIGASASFAGLVLQSCRTMTSRPPASRAGIPGSLGGESPPPDLLVRGLAFPVAGVFPFTMADSFLDPRGAHLHEAVDILAPKNTPVIAVDDGTATRMLQSRNGGITLYHVDATQQYCYYYAHLARYAPDLREGEPLRRGQLVGFVGTTGNAPPQTPHLHFAIFRIEGERGCFGGPAINPYPLLVRSEPSASH